jgi:vancomycin resistance protein YoaR
MKSLTHLKPILFPLALLLATAVTSDGRSAPRAAVTPDVVGNFSTSFIAGQPRVINIRRAAQLLDGTVINPGGGFSMNQDSGRERAREASYLHR